VDGNGTIRVHALISSLTWGGAEMLLSEFAAGAPAAGIELSVGYLEARDGNPAAARLRSKGIEPILVPIRKPRPILDRRNYREIRRHLEQVQPDVLHTHLGYADLFGGPSARALRIPAVSTIHNVLRRRRREPALYAKERLFGFTRRRCMTRVITVSDAARRSYLELNLDVPDRVVTVHNGIAAEAVTGQGRAVRAELGLDPDEFVVGIMAVLREKKGHDVALAAISALRQRFPRLRLLIGGDGPDRADIERLAAPLGSAVTFTGHRDDVMAVADALDVLVHPTSVDAFPTTLLEAMAASVPVVATAVGGIPEIVEHNVGGILLDPPPKPEQLADALVALLENPQLRRQIGARGRERYEREFTAEAWARRTRAVYEAALRQ
jgi:glycosyltransferase involved in cell wall biosynthesis